MPTIALDAMGGDHAPDEIVMGALDASEIDTILVGDRARLEKVLAAAGADLPIVDAPEVIEMGDDPAAAIREKRGASISVAARMVASGEAAGLVSAGSTGAAMAAAALIIGRLKGVSRPAIATIFPFGSPTVVLDSGANVEVKPEHLAQFGVMGAAVAQTYLDVENPKVGLLNIGEEPGKGRDLERAAHGPLSEIPYEFVGNVEGRDLGRGAADVFVTDGFTGNILLKTAEGTARVVGRAVLEALSGDADEEMQDALGKVLPKLMMLRERFNPESYGGAHLVGTKGVVVIGHGSSSRTAIANALRLASEGATKGLVERVGAGLGG